MAASLTTSPGSGSAEPAGPARVAALPSRRSPRLEVLASAATDTTPLPSHRPLPPAALPVRLAAQPEGMLQVHTAPFRGSANSVLSQALRSAGLGSRVLVSQLLKGGVDQGLAASPWLCGRLQWLRPAVVACLAEPARDHDPSVLEAVQAVWAYSRQQLLQGAVDLMVLDELGLAVELGYVPMEEVLTTLEQRPPHLDVILTGPCMGPELMALADQVTQLRRGF
ncbi:cob(I)yrinic acid a,c-diamide adenosyltransferase [Cyanobium sp. NIES-981]|uniref:cob(I)yrinic acid a,c-diamide adenosyltransferase n=1 Tax=Cyanobium sp. NIES-981 TaxID=1851505 RepID=UPI0007DE1D12|nr:cob(I)yrinic acid a,c-diamide adenosyltransferase [Cyanobium sp. NIES-981]SBO43661.1 Cob(I)alamin adenosyltransferase [Cyanobium sp. NIES-981]